MDPTASALPRVLVLAPAPDQRLPRREFGFLIAVPSVNVRKFILTRHSPALVAPAMRTAAPAKARASHRSRATSAAPMRNASATAPPADVVALPSPPSESLIIVQSPLAPAC